MSRNIDPHSVLTEEEVRYLTARGRFDVLAENAAYLITAEHAPDGSESTENPEPVDPAQDSTSGSSDDSGAGEGDGLAQVEVVDYGKLKRDALEALFAERNADRPDNGLPLIAAESTATKPDLIAILLADDALLASRQ